MDSITHSLYRAITVADAEQKTRPNIAGLRPMALYKTAWESYSGAAGTDLFISLDNSPDLLALQLEFIAIGFRVPAQFALNGVDVIISPGRVEVHAATDDGNEVWSAYLDKGPDGRGARTLWVEVN